MGFFTHDQYRIVNFYTVLFFLIIFLFTWVSDTILFAGEATLTWDPPTTNVDNTELTDLAGYKVYYGTSPGKYGEPIDVQNVIKYTVPNLIGGDIYYFAVTAYDTLMNESGFSNEVSKTILSGLPGNIDIVSPGSANRVDGYDLLSLEIAMWATPSSPNWNPEADIDGNEKIDESDMNILIQNFGVTK